MAAIARPGVCENRRQADEPETECSPPRRSLLARCLRRLG